eukprot:TRINITY_DN65984_c0_g1_i1.p1 TRINITY_DN65984_c0_g1~~TRINITY_DN65984_c0_g1_i1.p1  ORF type:complete len:165 (-),score=27.09 TRINITY_DN65984_c0_g1_i1:106-600(-)
MAHMMANTGDGAMDLGENHIRRKMAIVKSRQKDGSIRLDETIRTSRELMLAGAGATVSSAGLGTSVGGGFWQSKRKGGDKAFVGQQANELSKFMSAESLTRAKEELNAALPTLRQVMRVDDQIDMKQMVKSQLCAFPGDPSSKEKGPKRDPNAKLRHMTSYRPL